ncbi:MAG: hypothetical protein HAW64_01740 [Alphaproteobacteria bacterium]|nr:hypothetical protein [Alphaproteobacteria bacterium]
MIIGVGTLLSAVLFISNSEQFSAYAQEQKINSAPTNKHINGASGLPLPRFVSLKHNRAIVRSGPRRIYPQLWEYRRATLPLEIIEEYGRWRRVRDIQGDEGWMAAQLFSAKRYVILRGTPTSHALRRAPHFQAGIIAFVQADVIAKLLKCQNNWCALSIKNKQGWLASDALWGLYDFEADDFEADNFNADD